MADVARDFSTEKRKKLAKKGHALPDGSFPIVTKADLKNAVQAYGRASNKAKTKRHIIKRARALGATSMLPDDWQKSDKSEANNMIECTHDDCDRSFLDEEQASDHAEVVHSFRDTQRSAHEAVRERYGRDSYVRDIGEGWLVIEIYEDRSTRLVKVSYAAEEGNVTLGDDEVEVVHRNAYLPVTKQESASLAMAQIGVDTSMAKGGKSAVGGRTPSDTPHEFAQEEPAFPGTCTVCGRRENHAVHTS